MLGSQSLRFLLDENIPKSVKRFLESKGLFAEYVPKGIKNSAVILLAKDKKSVLITRDSDFMNTVLYPPKEFFGIIVFQIHPPKSEKLVKALSMLLKKVDKFEGKLFVVGEFGFKEIQ